MKLKEYLLVVLMACLFFGKVSFSEDFISKCLHYYENSFIQMIKNYKYRIRPFYENYGCEAVKIFAHILLFDNDDFYIYFLKFEENPNIFKYFLIIDNYMDSDILNESIFTNMVIRSELNGEDYEEISYLLRILTDQGIEINPSIFNRILISAKLSETVNEVYQWYSLLGRLSNKDLITLWSLYTNIENPSNEKFRRLLREYIYIKENITPHIKINSLFEYVNGNLLLPTLLEDIKNYNIANPRVYQKVVIKILNQIVEDRYSISSALILISNDFDIINQIIKSGKYTDDEIIKVYTYIINNKNFFEKLLIKKMKSNVCSRENNELDKVWNKENLEYLLNFYNRERNIFRKLSNSMKFLPHFIYVAKSYSTLPKDEWLIFKNLLLNVSKDINLNVAFLIFLQEDIRINGKPYIKYIKSKPDYDRIIYHNFEEVHEGFSAPKYIYILITSYPSRNDPSILDRVICILLKNQPEFCKKMDKDKHKIIEEIKKLADMPIDELSEHLYTTKEKIFHYIDKGSDLIGINPQYLAVKIGTKKFLKKTIKMLKINQKVNKTILYRIKYKDFIKNFVFKNEKNKERYENTKKIYNKYKEKIENTSDFIITIGELTLYGFPTNTNTKEVCDEY